jgi:hypothetical protein
MGVNVYWYQHMNIEYAGTEIAVPYQIRYADLTMDY